MQLYVLGSGAACPPAGQNSSGYLVSEQGHRVLLDCGQGVASTLLNACPALDIDDIIITHMHADHFIDVLALRFRITRDMGGIAAAQRRITLHLPPGGLKALAAILDAVTFPEDFCSNTFGVREYDPSQPLKLGPLTARFAQAIHYIPAWSVQLEGSSKLTYSGDTAPSEKVVELARGSDLFVCEATLAEPETGDARGHSTAEQAAEMACAADAKQLLLTHFWFDADLADSARRARGIYAGPLQVAHDGLSLRV